MTDKLEFWAEYLHHAQTMTNVTLVSEGGQHKSTHALLLASVSEFLSCLLFEVKDIKEKTVILLPDFTMEEVEDCLMFILTGEARASTLVNTLEMKVKHVAVVKEEKCDVGDENKQHLSKNTESALTDISNALIQVEKLEVIYFEDTDNIEEVKPIENTISPNQCKTDINDIFECIICTYNFKTKKSLAMHQRREHTSTDEGTWFKHTEKLGDKYKCKLCTKYVTKSSFSDEVKAGRDQRKKIKEHIYITHQMGTRMKCSECGKKFHFQWELNKHTVQHTAGPREKNHVCIQCGKKFTLAITLKIHEVRKHGTEDEVLDLYKFICSYCDKRFYMKGHLTNHEEIHGDSVISCTQCEETFKAKTHFRYHFKIKHMGLTISPITEEEKIRRRMNMMIARERKKTANGGKRTVEEKKKRAGWARMRNERIRRRKKEEEKRGKEVDSVMDDEEDGPDSKSIKLLIPVEKIINFRKV